MDMLIENQERFQEVFGISEDIQDKMVDIYYYMTERKCYRLEFVFANGDTIRILREEEK